ncbi:nucleoside phosphorylase domain-containing protein [Trichoderma camerunense]
MNILLMHLPAAIMASYDSYTVAWITTTMISSLAARRIFDDNHEISGPNVPGDFNAYHFGRMGKHNVVVCYLPQGDESTSATVKKGVDNMLGIFHGIRVAVLVGIGGGVPSDQHDIRLGDVVVSGIGSALPGLVRYDYDITVREKTFHLSQSNIPASPAIGEAVEDLRIRYLDTTNRLASRALYVIDQFPVQGKNNPCARPDQKTDKLYKPHHKHPGDVASCSLACGDSSAGLVERSPRVGGKENPVVHYGLIASSNRPMKDALIRDKLALEKKVLCFENEAAVMISIFPSFVIKGISDYADTHCNDLSLWKGYATAAASAYAKDFLYVLSPGRVKAEEPVQPLQALPNPEPTPASPIVSAPASFRIWLEKKPHSVEGHTAECTLTFNGRVIWGPRSCHENTTKLGDALYTVDPRFQLTFDAKRKTIEGHTCSISIMAGGRYYLDRLSTHDNMAELCRVINICQGSEPTCT